MIESFGDKETERVFRRQARTRFSKPLQRAALRKLLILDAAVSVADLSAVPGNRLERLKGDRSGEYSIRVNEQWRICFRWDEGNARAVQIVDYH